MFIFSPPSISSCKGLGVPRESSRKCIGFNGSREGSKIWIAVIAVIARHRRHRKSLEPLTAEDAEDAEVEMERGEGSRFLPPITAMTAITRSQRSRGTPPPRSSRIPKDLRERSQCLLK